MGEVDALILGRDAAMRTAALGRLVATIPCHVVSHGIGPFITEWAQRPDHPPPPILIIVGDHLAAVAVLDEASRVRDAAMCPVLWLHPPGVEPVDVGCDLIVPLDAPEPMLHSALRTLERLSMRERGLQQMARHVPQSLRWAIDRGESLDPQSKFLSILFADLRGFTDASGFASPADLIRLLNDYIEAASRVITMHHGIVDKFTGDGICAYFGYDNNADAAANAVRAALALQGILEQLKVTWFDQGILPLGAGVGVTTGTVTVGAVGSHDRADYTIIGSTANLAARLQAHAQGGEVIIDVPTAERIRSAFKLGTPRNVMIKGFSQAVTVYSVNAAPNSVRRKATIV